MKKAISIQQKKNLSIDNVWTQSYRNKATLKLSHKTARASDRKILRYSLRGVYERMQYLCWDPSMYAFYLNMLFNLLFLKYGIRILRVKQWKLKVVFHLIQKEKVPHRKTVIIIINKNVLNVILQNIYFFNETMFIHNM